MIVLKDQKINAKSSPKDLYTYPPNKYVANLFDDVNEVKINGTKFLLYPNKIKVVDKSTDKGRVLNSYFKGTHWLIEVSYLEKTLFVNHHKNIDKGTEVFLSFYYH